LGQRFLCCDPVIGEAVEVAGEGVLRSLVPLADSISLIREITVRGDTRPMTTHKINVIELRKYLSPYDSGDLVKENILSLDL
jgi:hypothetical protein